MIKIIAIILATFCIQSFADNVPYGIPTTPYVTTTLYRMQYTSVYYNLCKVPVVVSEHLLASEVGGKEPRINFHVDKQLQVSFRSYPKDYKRSHYDMGHMAPAADMKTNKDALAESFNLSNAVPQAPKNNRQIWRFLETRVREIAVTLSDVYVFTGAIYDKQPQTIGNKVCIPAALFKVIIDTKTNKSVGFIIPNTNEVSHKNFNDYRVTMSQVEFQSGIDFTPTLVDTQSTTLKNTIGIVTDKK